MQNHMQVFLQLLYVLSMLWEYINRGFRGVHHSRIFSVSTNTYRISVLRIQNQISSFGQGLIYLDCSPYDKLITLQYKILVSKYTHCRASIPRW